MIRNLIKKLSRQHVKKELYSLGVLGVRTQKRVLFSYLTDSFEYNYIDYNFVSNRKECQLILSLLLKKEYIVDVVDCRDNFTDRGIEYDVVIGFGEPYRKAKLKYGGQKVLYLTEGPPCFSKQNESLRCQYFYQRHHSKVDIERSLSYYTEDDLINANKIIALGRKHSLYISEKYKKETYNFFPLGIPVQYKKTKFKKSKNILWFGSRGVIHKGLDLLIDTFSDLPDWNLHVCGANEKDVKRIMRVGKNVKFYGKVDVASQTFKELIDLCNFKYLLSASEALPTSVLTVMRAGIIPVISDNCGEVIDSTIVVKDIDICNIKKSILNTYNYTANELEVMSKLAVDEVDSKYTVDRFLNDFNRILKVL